MLLRLKTKVDAGNVDRMYIPSPWKGKRPGINNTAPPVEVVAVRVGDYLYIPHLLSRCGDSSRSGKGTTSRCLLRKIGGWCEDLPRATSSSGMILRSKHY